MRNDNASWLVALPFSSAIIMLSYTHKVEQKVLQNTTIWVYTGNSRPISYFCVPVLYTCVV